MHDGATRQPHPHPLLPPLQAQVQLHSLALLVPPICCPNLQPLLQSSLSRVGTSALSLPCLQTLPRLLPHVVTKTAALGTRHSKSSAIKRLPRCIRRWNGRGEVGAAMEGLSYFYCCLNFSVLIPP